MTHFHFKDAKNAHKAQIKMLLLNKQNLSVPQIKFLIQSSTYALIMLDEYKNDFEAEKISMLNEKLSYYEPSEDFRKEDPSFYGDEKLLDLLKEYIS
jgi:hypothetical protein